MKLGHLIVPEHCRGQKLVRKFKRGRKLKARNAYAIMPVNDVVTVDVTFIDDEDLSNQPVPSLLLAPRGRGSRGARQPRATTRGNRAIVVENTVEIPEINDLETSFAQLTRVATRGGRSRGRPRRGQ
jgi:hypothetical protein